MKRIHSLYALGALILLLCGPFIVVDQVIFALERVLRKTELDQSDLDPLSPSLYCCAMLRLQQK